MKNILENAFLKIVEFLGRWLFIIVAISIIFTMVVESVKTLSKFDIDDVYMETLLSSESYYRVGYDRFHDKLVIEYEDGTKLVYSDFDSDTMKKFADACYSQEFYHENIMGQYPVLKLIGGKK